MESVYQQGYVEDQGDGPVSPHDVAAERVVLGSMMVSKAAIEEVLSVIHFTDIYRPVHIDIFNAIVHLYESNSPTDIVAVADYLTRSGDINRIGGHPYLLTLIHDVPTSANAGYYAEIVKKYAKLRAIAEMGTRFTQMAQVTKIDDIEDISLVVEDALLSLKERYPASKGGIQLISKTFRRTRWMWNNRISLRAVGLLAGLRDAGKTSLLCKIIADATHGLLDGEYFGTPVSVLYIFTEDSEEMTISPRLKAAGADLDRVYKWSVPDEKNMTGFILSENIDKLRSQLAQYPEIKLVIIDPLSGVLTAAQRSNDGIEMRRVVQQLSALADEMQVSILGNAHFRKAKDADALNRVTGTGELVNVVRTVLAVAVVDDAEYDEKTCVLSVEKNNLGRCDLPGLLYQFREMIVGHDPEDGKPVVTVYIEMIGETSVTVSSISAAQANGESGSTIECEQGLNALVVGSPDGVLRREAVTWAKEQGFSKYALEAAVKSLQGKKMIFSVPTGNGAERKYSAIPQPKLPEITAQKAPEGPVAELPPVTPTDCPACHWPLLSEGHEAQCGQPDLFGRTKVMQTI